MEPASIRTAVATAFDRAALGPLPDDEKALWLGFAFAGIEVIGLAEFERLRAALGVTKAQGNRLMNEAFLYEPGDPPLR